MARRKKIESEDESFMIDAEDEGGETFAESAGTPANAHAKKVAKAGARAKALSKSEPRGSFYMVKNLTKVVKVLVKSSGVHEVYVGSLKRHKDQLASVIAKWKKDGDWIEPHQYEGKIKEIRESLKG